MAANRQFFSGLIAGADDRDPEMARVFVRLALNSPKLKSEAISMIGAGKLTPRDLDLVISLLRSGDVEPWQCVALSYGRGLDHLSQEDVVPLLKEVAAYGAAGLWAMFDMMTMVLHGGKRPSAAFVALIKSSLLDSHLFDGVTRGAMDGHHLEEMVKLLIAIDTLDKRFARTLVKQLLSVCTGRERDIFHHFDVPVRNSLKSLISLHPATVWNGIAGRLGKGDWIERNRLEGLLKDNLQDHYAAGLPFSLPPKLYLDWVRKSPAVRAQHPIVWLPIVSQEDDGTLSWHPALEQYIGEFAAAPGVLGALAARLRPGMWWGSLSSHLEPFLPMLENWRGHALSDVRRWARKQVAYIRAEMQEADRMHDEDGVRLL